MDERHFRRTLIGLIMAIVIAAGANGYAANRFSTCDGDCGPNGECEFSLFNCSWCQAWENPDRSCQFEWENCEEVSCDCDGGSGWECYYYEL
ncbi:MAG: hypothetical protein M3R55_04275 [Acidobacteriota bacterium]|nr:hypothetical protein [Acidobacteriota bacterium]